jgi:hypothetical protein
MTGIKGPCINSKPRGMAGSAQKGEVMEGDMRIKIESSKLDLLQGFS